MPVYTIQGNLLDSDCTVIAHQANCFSTMGAGIAKQIKSKYPEAYDADQFFGYSPEERLGKYSVVVYGDKPLIVCNLYGQYRYGRDKQHTDYQALSSALHYMYGMINVNKDSFFTFPIKIGLPFGMGAGLAGGDWDTIYAIIEEVSRVHELDTYLYKLM